MEREKTVESYIHSNALWNAELKALRAILLETDLTETIKWGAPCYVHAGQNVVGLLAFKNYFGLWFHQGVFLDDKAQVLVNAQEGKTQALRQWRMTSKNDIKPNLIRAYVLEAMALAKAGKRVEPRAPKPLVVPPELKSALKDNAKLKTAYEAMSLSCRREYADHISEAKQEKTKQRRLEKIIPMILDGCGLHDKYR